MFWAAGAMAVKYRWAAGVMAVKYRYHSCKRD